MTVSEFFIRFFLVITLAALAGGIIGFIIPGPLGVFISVLLGGLIGYIGANLGVD